MRLSVLRLAICCALSLALTPLSSAQSPKDDGDKDLEAMQHYTLTMDKVTQYTQTFTDLAAYAKAHPEEAKDSDSESNESLAAAEHRISSHPAVVAVLAKHNFTAREFILFGITLFQASFAAETAKQNGVDPAKMAAEAHVNPANMTFVVQHKAEIEAIMAQIKKTSGQSQSSN